MKKPQKILFITSALLSLGMISTQTVLGLEMNVDRNGTVRFYQDDVLGKNSQGQAGQAAPTQPLKTVSAYEKQAVRVRTSNRGSEVEIQQKTSLGQEETNDFAKSEKMNDESLQLEFPAGMRVQQNQLGQAASGSAQAQERYLERIRSERQERVEENIQIRDRQKNQERILELESRQVKAALNPGAEFKLDPETNQITVITPSGQEHLLNHLPDQAVEQLSQLGLNPAQELKLETNEKGDVYYQARATQQRRLFGLFPREVELQASLNDSTGEVQTDVATDTSFMNQLLDLLSF